MVITLEHAKLNIWFLCCRREALDTIFVTRYYLSIVAQIG